MIQALLATYETDNIFNKAFLPLKERLRDFLVLHFRLKVNGRKQLLKKEIPVYLPSVLAYDMKDGENCCKRAVYPVPEGYELVSGHRRRLAAQKLGLPTVPVLVREMTDDEAVILMVDSNLQRENLLPSEKAFAYKMKLEAMNRQGRRTDLTSTTVVPKFRSNEVIGKESGESRETVRRYIRLTNLVPPLLQMVDDGRIAFSPAVELSYLTRDEQAELWDLIGREDATPSLSQALRMKQLSREAKLTPEVLYAILTEEKPNQKEQIRIKTESLRKYFPRNYSAQQMEREIIKLLEARYRAKNREER